MHLHSYIKFLPYLCILGKNKQQQYYQNRNTQLNQENRNKGDGKKVCKKETVETK